MLAPVTGRSVDWLSVETRRFVGVVPIFCSKMGWWCTFDRWGYQLYGGGMIQFFMEWHGETCFVFPRSQGRLWWRSWNDLIIDRSFREVCR